MTASTFDKDRRNFDTDDGAGDEVEPSAGQLLLNASRMVGLQLRRTVVFVSIFVVMYLVTGSLWYQGVQAERALNAESELQLTLLSQPAPKPELLLKQVEGWDTAYQVTLDQRISRPEDSDLIGRVIDAAHAAGLVVLETGTNDDGITTLENDSYTATPVLLKANGTLDGIERFLNVLETDMFAAFEVQASMFNADEVGYLLTLRGVFYSLPENYGDTLTDDGLDILVIPIDKAVDTPANEVAP